jgi:hypothetical protein
VGGEERVDACGRQGGVAGKLVADVTEIHKVDNIDPHVIAVPMAAD